jgi:Glycosyl transferase family 2
MPASAINQESAKIESPHPGWSRYLNHVIADELSRVTKYYDHVIQWLRGEHDKGNLFARIECPQKQTIGHDAQLPDLRSEEDRRTAIVINGAFNHHFDVQSLLLELRAKLSRSSRVLLVVYNPYLSWLYKMANRLGIRKGDLPTTFLTRVDLQNLAKVSGLEIIRQEPIGYWPWRFLGFGAALNRLLPLIPVVRWLSLAFIVSLRVPAPRFKPGLSCVIPARNERGNIEHALRRFPDLGCQVEIIFVEGHSNDGTWEEIQRVASLYKERFKIQTLQQTGKGKADAVRLGFAHATNDLLTVLDADLTMPPEMLGRFYCAYCDGYGDFINGSRLVYPMEGEAMQFLNRLGNIFFAKSLSWVLSVHIGDSLCGTKLLSRADYKRFERWRADFGEFDPFGDFELLFPAAELDLGIVDIPVRYRARTYGSTNIHRFRHGLLLLRMTWVGFIRIKLGIR